jgi:hypothetical protein
MSPRTDQTLADIVAKREIREVVHFTTNLGFLGCLATGSVLSRIRLREEQLLAHILTFNAPFRTEEQPRFDKTEKWIDYVNLSISEINSSLFRYSTKWHARSDIFWVIMSFRPDIMSDDGVYFSTTNSIYPLTKRKRGVEGLEQLFAPVVARKPGWTVVRQNRPDHLPTCEQAEVLYPQALKVSHLQRVYCKEGEESDWAYAMLSNYHLSGVEIVTGEDKFRGAPN